MNARQRRKVYRAMPKVGTIIIINNRPVTVIGFFEGFPRQYGEERMNVPSLYRIKASYPGTDATCAPLLSRTRHA